MRSIFIKHFKNSNLLCRTLLSRKLVRFCIALLSVALLFSVNGCSAVTKVNNLSSVQKDGTEVKKNKDALMDQGPIRGGSLKLFSTQPDTLNPIITQNKYVREMLSNVYEGLVKIDEKLNPVPVLAEKWTVSSDLLTWTFTLRKDVFWHDAMPFSAEDVEFTLDMIVKNQNNSSYKKVVENIAAFMAIDKQTIKISLKSPNGFTPELMTFPIMCKHYYINESFINSGKNMKPMGTGPYKFISYTPEKEVKLMMNDKWWGRKNSQPELPNLPYITELDYRLYPVGKDAVNAFQRLEVDAAGMSVIDAAKYKGRSDLLIKRYSSREYNFISFNTSKPALGDKNVRQAIAYSIDRSKIIDNFLPGLATISDLPVLTGSWLNDINLKTYELSKDKAAEILTKSGWKQYQNTMYKYYDGVYQSLNFEVLVNQENEVRVRTAQIIADQLTEAGIKVQINKVDFNTFSQLLQNKKYDIAVVGCYIPQTSDMSYMYASWNNKPRLGTENMYNIAGYSNPEVDKLLGNILNTKGSIDDGTKIKEQFDLLKKQVLEDLPYFGLFFQKDTILYNKRIRGEIKPNVFNVYNDINKWYLP